MGERQAILLFPSHHRSEALGSVCLGPTSGDDGVPPNYSRSWHTCGVSPTVDHLSWVSGGPLVYMTSTCHVPPAIPHCVANYGVVVVRSGPCANKGVAGNSLQLQYQVFLVDQPKALIFFSTNQFATCVGNDVSDWPPLGPRLNFVTRFLGGAKLPICFFALLAPNYSFALQNKHYITLIVY